MNKNQALQQIEDTLYKENSILAEEDVPLMMRLIKDDFIPLVLATDEIVNKLQHTSRDPWGQDEDYPRHDWAGDVLDNNTNLGYWDWVNNQRELEECDHKNAILSDSNEPKTYHCPDCGTNFIGNEDLDPAERVVHDLVHSVPLKQVMLYFAEGEIESIAKSENCEYGEREIRWQLYTDLINGDKSLIK